MGLNEKLVQQMMDRSEVNSTLRSFQLSVLEIGRLCHEYQKIIHETPDLYRYSFSSKTDVDWVSRENESEVLAEQWKMETAEEEDFY